MSDFSFSGLTPEVILDALEQIGIYPESGLLALNSYENRVYQFMSDRRIRYVVKFYRPARWTREQLIEEHQFALELQDGEVPVVAPCVIDGETLFDYQGFMFALFPSVGGRQFEADNLDQLEWMGRYIGRIHQIGKSKPFAHRPAITLDSYLTRPREILTNSELLPETLHTAFFTILDILVEKTTPLYTPVSSVRLHGDCHAGNILWWEGPSFVDLDDCRMGPAIQDLWMMLSGDRIQQQLQLDTLVEAYEEFTEFDTREVKLIEPLRAMRMVHYMSWLAQRWSDPAFPRAFPWFAESKYWEQQILALKEQVAALDETPLKLGGQGLF